MTIFTPEGYPERGPANLSPTFFLDFDDDIVASFTEEAVKDISGDRLKAVALYYAVRDRVRYDPFGISLDKESFTASYVLRKGASYCIPKAVLLAACARCAGIPSAIGLSDVVNHLSSPKLKERMGGRELFLHHGYAVLLIDDHWVKAAPAFNIELCNRFDVMPTEFDGHGDAVLQEFDKKNRQHMNYVRDHGIWSDLPYNRIVEEFRGYYPPSFYNADAGAPVF
jgi:transglutaminase-like putative cysteine protease